MENTSRKEKEKKKKKTKTTTKHKAGFVRFVCCTCEFHSFIGVFFDQPILVAYWTAREHRRMEKTEETTELPNCERSHPSNFFFFLIYRLLMLPPSVCTFASIPGPTVSSIYKVLKEILGCALREGIYTEHLFVLLDRRTLYK